MDNLGDTSYWRGLAHGLLLALPVLAFLYRKWRQSEAAVAGAASALATGDAAPPMLGTFLNELFTFEVVLVAGAEMKAVKDQLHAAEQEGNARRVDALRGRLLDVARVLEQKLQVMMPIVQFLTEQSVTALATPEGDNTAVDAAQDTKKDK
ncbi:hypothetical protein PybrP1_007621 [[Pythium] brassicae (nom. inval.)]|nr:hypothetical protein PybrP1_007621 [[Pythium] brassicae (nom. inval.)]